MGAHGKCSRPPRPPPLQHHMTWTPSGASCAQVSRPPSGLSPRHTRPAQALAGMFRSRPPHAADLAVQVSAPTPPPGLPQAVPTQRPCLTQSVGETPEGPWNDAPVAKPVSATLLRFSPSMRHPSLKRSCVSVHMCVAHAPGHFGSTRGGVLREQHLPATAGAQWWPSGPAGQGRGERRRDLASA